MNIFSLFQLLFGIAIFVVALRWLTPTYSEITAKRFQFKPPKQLPGWVQALLQWMWRHTAADTLRALDVLEINKVRFTLLQIAIMVGVGLVASLFLSIFGIGVGIVIGWFVPGFLIQKRFKTWQSEVMLEFPELTSYLAVLFTIGINITEALEAAVDVVEEPLKGELKRLNSSLDIDGNYSKGLESIASRINDWDAQAVFDALLHAWDTQVTPEVFDGFTTTMRDLMESKIVAKTKKLPILYGLLPVVGLINMALLVGVPAAEHMLHSMSFI